MMQNTLTATMKAFIIIIVVVTIYYYYSCCCYYLLLLFKELYMAVLSSALIKLITSKLSVTEYRLKLDCNFKGSN